MRQQGAPRTRVERTVVRREVNLSLAREGMGIETTGRTVLAACSEGDALRANLALLRRFTKYEPVDAIAARRDIAVRLLEAGRYT